MSGSPGPAGGLRTRRLPDGRLDTQARTAAGRWVRVHSVHEPEAEARALVDEALEGRAVPPVVAVLGVGLGYVIDELERRRPDVRVVALELTSSLVDGWAERRSWDEAIEQGRMVVGTAPGYDLPTVAWPAAAVDEPPLVVVHPVIGSHHSGELEGAHKAFQQFLYEQRANADARRRLAQPYLLQTLANLPGLAASSDLGALDGLALGHTVVVCGAGPSLDHQLTPLAAHRERVWLVALDTALRPLVGAGIVPDLVVSIDPTSLNGRHLLDLPTRARPWIVGETSLDPRVFAAFAGRIFACRLGQADPWPWLEGLGVSASRIRVWGSVLTASCDVVSRLQASRVAFVGMDLAFTNDQVYCRGTSFEEDWSAQQERDGLDSLEAVWRARMGDHQVEEPDTRGRPVRTSPQMVAFRNWVRAFAAARPTVEFVNATGAGILHGAGIRQGMLDDVLDGVPATWSREDALRSAARPAFADRCSHMETALAEAGETDTTNQIEAWAKVIPNLDESRVRWQLQHAARRLRARKGAIMSTTADLTTDTDWVDVPYDESHFTAKAPLEWRVEESGVTTYAYHVHGKTMTLAFKIDFSRLAGQPATELYLRVPGAYLPARGMANPIWMCSQIGKECGYATVHPGVDSVVLLRATEEPFPVECDFFAFGQLTFEVQ